MYPRIANQSLKFRALPFIAFFLALVGTQQCHAQTGVTLPAVATKTDRAVSLSASLTGLPSVNNLKRHHVKGVEIYEYDSTPVDGKAPLLLVHGLDGEN